mmetsp:Transcript_19520/g.46160  ORF Transcript_19520/g.46160 Transcript_19520/m.46160 type:complete len:206 (+) Transcript_19520:263-880(+)
MHRCGPFAHFALRHGQNLRRALWRRRQSVHRHPPARQRDRGRGRKHPLPSLHRQPIPVLLDRSAGRQAELRRWQQSRPEVHRHPRRYALQSAQIGRRCRPLRRRGQFGPREAFARSARAEHPCYAHPLGLRGYRGHPHRGGEEGGWLRQRFGGTQHGHGRCQWRWYRYARRGGTARGVREGVHQGQGSGCQVRDRIQAASARCLL